MSCFVCCCCCGMLLLLLLAFALILYINVDFEAILDEKFVQFSIC